jgi:hypothetical protein
MEIVAFLQGGEPCKPGECYMCWQVGRKGVKGSCVLLHNEGTKHEWRCVSCAKCAAKAVACTYVKVPSRIIATRIK